MPKADKLSPSKESVTIIGAGIVGICTALALLERGFNVEILDRDPPAEGASFGNAGVISPWTSLPQSLPGIWKNIPKWLLDPEGPVRVRPSYFFSFLPWAIKFLRLGQIDKVKETAKAMNALNGQSLELYAKLLKDTNHEHLVTSSNYVYVYKDINKANIESMEWRIRRDRGAPVRLINAKTLKDMEPAIASDYQAAIIMENIGRALDPGLIGKALMEKAQQHGATFKQVKVRALHPNNNNGWTVETEEGQLECQKVVVAAGAWSARLLEPLGYKLPLEAERGYHLLFKNPGITINNSIMDTEGKMVLSSMDAGVRCAGTAEFAGLDASPNYKRAKKFAPMAKRLFPSLNIDSTESWSGIRPSFPDSLPALGSVLDYEHLYVAFGHCHYGMGMGPKSAQLVADIVAGMIPNIDMSPYALNRFQ